MSDGTGVTNLVSSTGRNWPQNADSAAGRAVFLECPRITLGQFPCQQKPMAQFEQRDRHRSVLSAPR